MGHEPLVEAARRAGVADPRLLDAIRATPRERFVPPYFAERAWRDAPIPIGHGQPTSQPSLIAQMIDALRLSGGETVLEIGTGHGYQTALLARLARRVYSVERHADLAARARANLAAAGVTNAEVTVGDGTAGLPEHAPFAAVLVSACAAAVPAPLAEQLAEGGRLVMPIRAGAADEVTLYGKRHGDLVRRRPVTRAHFVPLPGAHAPAPEDSDGPGRRLTATAGTPFARAERTPGRRDHRPPGAEPRRPERQGRLPAGADHNGGERCFTTSRTSTRPRRTGRAT